MKHPTRDTHPDAEAFQLKLLREATLARRFHLVRSLSQNVIELSRRAIRRQRPDLDEMGVAIEWVELHYGTELAGRVRDYVNRPGTAGKSALI